MSGSVAMENISVTQFNMGHMRFDLSGIYRLPADHQFAGRIMDVPMVSYHISLPGRSVLVDAINYDLQDIPPSFLIPDYAPPPGLLEQMKDSGINAESVSDVIITHAHFDHYGALCTAVDGRYKPAFPNARHYLNTADWHPKRFNEMDQSTLGLVEQHGLLELTKGKTDLGDGLTLLPMPGETAGHQILRLTTGKRDIYFAGDLYHHPLEFADTAFNVRWAARKSMGRSKLTMMKSIAGGDGLAHFTHISGVYGVVEQKDGVFAWQERSFAGYADE